MPPSAHALATMMTAMPTTKPKIGFSIDSIVGNRNQNNKSPINYSQHDSEGSEAPLSPLSDYGYQHSNNSPKHNSEIAATLKLNEYAQLELRNKIKRSLSTSPPVSHHNHHHIQNNHHNSHQNSHEKSMESDIQRHEIQKLQLEAQARLTDDRRSQSPQSASTPPPNSTSQSSHSQHQSHMQKQPIIVPGIPASILRPSMQHGTQLPPTLTPEMMAAQNPFFRLVTFQSLPT